MAPSVKRWVNYMLKNPAEAKAKAEDDTYIILFIKIESIT
jgi:hypothetical protein